MIKETIKSGLIILLFFLLLLIFTKIAGPIPFSVNSITTNKTDAFNVTGIGKVVVKPDIATVNVGISANGTTVKIIQEQINSVINKVTQGIKNLGIEDKDIKTAGYSIYPNYDYKEGQKISGYQASTTLIVKVRDLNKINDVIDSATQNGANQVSGINFDVDDKTKSENEARNLAVKEAKEKAAEAAKIAGFNLGKIINYQENFAGNNRIYPMMAGVAEASTKDSSTNIQAGSSEIQVTVTLSFEIR